MKFRQILFPATLATLALCTVAFTQGPDAKVETFVLTKAAKEEAVSGLSKQLLDSYVFPEIGQKMDADVRARMSKGEYDAIADGDLFARTLTDHLQAISKDKHLRVRFSKNPLPVPQPGRPPTAEELAEEERYLRQINGGFEKVERMPGNIGYFDFRFFGQHPVCYEAATAAYNFVKNADALIIDVRKNGGGSPAMVAFMCSYLFDQPTHLNDLYFRPQNETRQFWTQGHVPGTKFLAKPVYVLTSNYTFSGAEEFSYNLRNLKRATLVGETTGGGAHPGGSRRLSEHFTAFIPTGRAISPITKTNWEGTGVEPHIKVKSDEALKAAHIDAVKNLLAEAKSAEDKERLQKVLSDLEK